MFELILAKENMKVSGLFKLPNSRGFNFKPRFYDEEKEEREKRIERIRQKYVDVEKGKNEKYISDIRGKFIGGYRQKTKDKHLLIRRIIVFVTIALLLLLVYLLSHWISVIVNLL